MFQAFVGRHEKSKGIEVLAEAIPQIAPQYPHVKFIFIGRDTERQESKQSYRQYLKEKLSGYNVEFIDQISHAELVKYFQESKISVFPSLYEPGGTVALESMACGCATITSNVGCFKETVNHGEDGIVVEAAVYTELRVRHEVRHLGPLGRQASQIEGDAANELLPGRGRGKLEAVRSQLRCHELVNVAQFGAIGGRNVRAGDVEDRLVSPVPFVLRASCDPTTQQSDLLFA